MAYYGLKIVESRPSELVSDYSSSTKELVSVWGILLSPCFRREIEHGPEYSHKSRMSEGCCSQTVVSPSKQNPGEKVPLIETGIILQASQHIACVSGKQFTDALTLQWA